jgi:D-glucosaminate-6-phosphate ammonia-lyase
MSKRRAFLQSAAGLPALTSLAAAQNAPQNAAPRDYFRELGLRPFINAAGTYTTLTASLMPPEVMDAIQYASSRFVHLNLLQDAVGARIASLLGAEAAMVTSGAAGAMTVGTAGVLTGADPDKIRRLPDLTGMKSEVLIQKAHRFGYDHAVRATGVRLVEIETEDDLRRAAGPQTAMMLFFNDAQARGKIDAPGWVRLGRQLAIPTFNDAAADTPPVSRLSEYIRLGFDLVCFSGGKALRGPQSAGILLGRKPLIEAARLNTSPYSDTIARGMKVNKEEMLGMLVALERFLHLDHAAERQTWDFQIETITRAVRDIPSVSWTIDVPPVANHTPHLKLRWDPSQLKLTPPEVRRKLLEGEPSIEVTPSTNESELVLTVWMLQPGEAEIIARRLAEILRAG